VFYWIYEVPLLLAVALFAVAFVGFCWLGILFASPVIAPWFQKKARLNEILGDYLQYFGVIYGLLLGLLAVATYQNHTDVEKAVASEASSLAALYRDISAYPDPDRTELKALIKSIPARPSRMRGRSNAKASIHGRSIGRHRCMRDWRCSTRRQRGRKHFISPRFANSTISLKRGDSVFSTSARVSLRSCG